MWSTVCLFGSSEASPTLILFTVCVFSLCVGMHTWLEVTQSLWFQVNQSKTFPLNSVFAIQPTLMEVERQLWHLKHSCKITANCMKSPRSWKESFWTDVKLKCWGVFSECRYVHLTAFTVYRSVCQSEEGCHFAHIEKCHKMSKNKWKEVRFLVPYLGTSCRWNGSLRCQSDPRHASRWEKDGAGQEHSCIHFTFLKNILVYLTMEKIKCLNVTNLFSKESRAS